ncbi:MAG: response regulator transcription factor [Acidaminococcaceae bacterium]|nr:response regulator transcription factor [Acidaminococcaceae bacterium]
MNGKLLIVDDNNQITDVLASYAAKEGWETLVARDGEEALRLFTAHDAEIAMILLDVMMPKKDGFEVCREIRKTSMVPIMMITARGEDFERIMGLDIGADDYIIKPFNAGEVMARVRAILRRIHPQGENAAKVLTVANLVIDIANYLVTIDGKEVPLTKREKEILYTLAANNKKVFSRDNLLDSIWGYDYYGDSRTVDSHIKRLRAKLDVFKHPAWDVKTIWGVGYRFEVKETGK